MIITNYYNISDAHKALPLKNGVLKKSFKIHTTVILAFFFSFFFAKQQNYCITVIRINKNHKKK